MFPVCRKAKLKWGRRETDQRKRSFHTKESTQESERGTEEEVLFTLKSSHMASKTTKEEKT